MTSRRFATRALGLVVLLVAGLVLGSDGVAQTYFRAGGISTYSGEIFYRTSAAGAWRRLEARLWLDAGFEVRTGMTGRVEMLLAPGSYIRAGSNTTFQLADVSARTVRIALVKGSVALEVTGPGGSVPFVVVETPHTGARFEGRGNYRINVTAGTTEVVTRDGLAVVASRGREVKVFPGIGARMGVGSASFDLFGAGDRRPDALDEWSRERAAALADVNERLLRDLTYAAERESADEEGAYGGGEGDAGESAAGVWIFDRDSGRYLLYPFGATDDAAYGLDFGYVNPLVLNPGYTARDWNYDRRAQDLSEPFGFRDRRARFLRRRGFVTSEPLIRVPFQGNTFRLPGVNMPFEARPFQTNPTGGVSRPPAVFRGHTPLVPRR